MKTCVECGERVPEEEGSLNEKGKFICLTCAQEIEQGEDRSVCPECGESSEEFESARVCPHCEYEAEEDDDEADGDDKEEA